MVAQLKGLVIELAKSARSPHVVGAGIGAKRMNGRPNSEPRLTLLVDKDVPKEQLEATVKQVNYGRNMEFDVLEVGDVRALGKLQL